MALLAAKLLKIGIFLGFVLKEGNLWKNQVRSNQDSFHVIMWKGFPE